MNRLIHFLKTDHRVPLFLLIIVAFLVPLLSPISEPTGYDALGTLLVSQAIVEHGTIRLDAYADRSQAYENFSSYKFYRQNGHIYYYFPPGTPLMAAPFVWIANRLGQDMASEDPGVQSNLQNWLSALTVAAVTLILYAIARCYLDRRSSYLLTIAFIFGSALMSTFASALWSLNTETLLTSSALLILVYKEKQKIASYQPLVLGSLLFWAFLTRPTAIAFIIPCLAYLLYVDWKTCFKVAFVLVVWMGAFVLFSYREFGQILPTYYIGKSFKPFEIINIYWLLFSPARGQLIYVPFLLVVLLFMLRASKIIIRQPLAWLAGFWIAAHILIIARNDAWWGGWGFGPRLLSDVLPAFYLLTALTWQAIQTAYSPREYRLFVSSFCVLAVLSIYINTVQGTWNRWTVLWNSTTNVDYHHEFFYDWEHPQFLSNRAMIWDLDAALQFPKIQAYQWGSNLMTVRSQATLEESWSDIKPGDACRWSDGAKASIAIKVDPNLAASSEQLEMQITAATYQPQSIDILLNGQNIGTIVSQEHNKTRQYLFPFDKALLNSGEAIESGLQRAEITFLIPGARYPIWDDLLQGWGIRWPGICIKKVSLGSQ